MHRAVKTSSPRGSAALAAKVAWALRPLVFHGPLVVASFVAVALVLATAWGLMTSQTSNGSAVVRALPFSAALVEIDANLPWFLLAWALAGWVWTLVGQRASPCTAREIRRGLISLGRWLSRLGWPLSLVVACLTLGVTWSQLPRPQHPGDISQYSAMLGHVPWSDAHGYYGGAQHLAATGELDYWNQRRPLNATLLSVRLGIAGFRLELAMLLQAALLATSLYLLANETGIRYGVWSGLATFAMTYAYAKHYIATTLSETLGITLGAIGAAILLAAMRRRSPWLAALACLALGLAMSARAGALFLLPALVAWSFWHFGAGWPRRLQAAILCAAGVLMALGVNQAILTLYGTGANQLGSNFSCVFCAMAEGTTWDSVAEKHKKELAQCSNEGERATLFYAKAISAIRADPSMFLCSAAKGEGEFLYQGIDFVPRQTALRISLPPRLAHWAKRVNRCIYGSLIVALAVVWWRRRREGDLRLGAIFILSLLASAPFVFIDEWRIFAASWPLMIALFAAALATPYRAAFGLDGLGTAARQAVAGSWVERAWNRWRMADVPLQVGVWVTVALPLLAIAGPWCAHRLSPQPSPAAIEAARAAGQRLIRGWPCTAAVVVVDEGDAAPAGMPAVTLTQVKQLVEIKRHETIGDEVPLPPTPFAFATVYDFVNSRSMVVCGPLKNFAIDSPYVRLTTDPVAPGRICHQVFASAADTGQ